MQVYNEPKLIRYYKFIEKNRTKHMSPLEDWNRWDPGPEDSSWSPCNSKIISIIRHPERVQICVFWRGISRRGFGDNQTGFSKFWFDSHTNSGANIPQRAAKGNLICFTVTDWSDDAFQHSILNRFQLFASKADHYELSLGVMEELLPSSSWNSFSQPFLYRLFCKLWLLQFFELPH